MIIWGFKSHALKLHSPEFFDMHFERIEGVGGGFGGGGYGGLLIRRQVYLTNFCKKCIMTHLWAVFSFDILFGITFITQRRFLEK